MKYLPHYKFAHGLGISARWDPLAVHAPGSKFNLLFFDDKGQGKNWLEHLRHSDQEDSIRRLCLNEIQFQAKILIIDDDLF